MWQKRCPILLLHQTRESRKKKVNSLVGGSWELRPCWFPSRQNPWVRMLLDKPHREKHPLASTGNKQPESQYPNLFLWDWGYQSLPKIKVKAEYDLLDFHDKFCCCSPVRTKLEREGNTQWASRKEGWKQQWIHSSKTAVNSCIQSLLCRKNLPS